MEVFPSPEHGDSFRDCGRIREPLAAACSTTPLHRSGDGPRSCHTKVPGAHRQRRARTAGQSGSNAHCPTQSSFRSGGDDIAGDPVRHLSRLSRQPGCDAARYQGRARFCRGLVPGYCSRCGTESRPTFADLRPLLRLRDPERRPDLVRGPWLTVARRGSIWRGSRYRRRDRRLTSAWCGCRRRRPTISSSSTSATLSASRRADGRERITSFPTVDGAGGKSSARAALRLPEVWALS